MTRILTLALAGTTALGLAAAPLNGAQAAPLPALNAAQVGGPNAVIDHVRYRGGYHGGYRRFGGGYGYRRNAAGAAFAGAALGLIGGAIAASAAHATATAAAITTRGTTAPATRPTATAAATAIARSMAATGPATATPIRATAGGTSDRCMPMPAIDPGDSRPSGVPCMRDATGLVDLDLAASSARSRSCARAGPCGACLPGRLLRVSCTDPLASLDIPNLVREEGDTLEGEDRIGATTRFWIRRGSGRCPGDSAKSPHS